MSDEAKITVYRRKMRAPSDTDVKLFPFQADIFPRSGGDHHGVGKTASEAMFNATRHWHAYEQRLEASRERNRQMSAVLHRLNAPSPHKPE